MARGLRSASAASSLAALLTLGVAGLPACLVDYEEGATLEVSARATLGSSTDVEGVALELEAAWLHVGQVRLLECPDDEEAFAPRSLRRLSPLSFARAHHTRADGRTLVGGHVLDLAGGRTRLGALRPPPLRYCTLEVTLSEPETESLGDVTALEADTIRVEGLRGQEPWAARSAGRSVLELELEPWVPSSNEPGALEVTFELSQTIGLVDTSAADPFDRGLDLLRELRGGATRAPL